MYILGFSIQIGQMAFKGMKSLNLIQSVVFETAYNTNENLLICAPTGAGKTNIAMLAVLHVLKQHLSQGVIKKDEFKVNAQNNNQMIIVRLLSVFCQCTWPFFCTLLVYL